MKKIFAILFFTLISYWVQAQQQQVDVIYLKNGSEFRGTLLEYKSDLVKIKTLNEVELTFSQAEVAKVTQEPIKLKAYKPYQFKERGIYKAIFGSFNAGTAAWNNDFAEGFGFKGILGYQWNRWIGTGIGLGIDNYYVGQGETVYPVFLELRGYFTQANIAPYYTLSGGYAFTIKHEDVGIIDAEGGYMWHPALGLRFGGSSKANFTLDAGVQFQKATFVRSQNNNGQELPSLTYEMFYKRLTIRIGMLF